MEEKKLSICIPAFNAGEWLEQTVMSCVDEVIELSGEIVVSDNNSTDSTALVLEELCKRYPGVVRVIRPNIHLSMTENWNYVTSVARGEYLVLLSADDLLGKGMCSAALEILDQNLSADVVSFEHDRLVHSGKDCPPKIVPRAVSRFLQDGQVLTIPRLLACNPLSINFSFIRKDSVALKKFTNGGELFRRNLMTADFDFWVGMTLAGANIFYAEFPRALYRVHANNLSGNRRRMLLHTILVLARYREELSGIYPVSYRLVMLRLWFRVILRGKKWCENKRMLKLLWMLMMGRNF